ncbi:hypothetical protein SODALDRAFT_95872 [Sodiomyces alkalinus F11]|uniref:Uncharacterized protein n=1 Tax=Sodiomyces alkalinus (strain CBS 110278 / VKM F-3762 / F11) TaxID=1314773 RepID=A0A3N2Q118_SODAK|nr:hypothetical protein SODALDRAFT_95872 [Sodiomyces alkalinus F11]ROT40406.1 hypothetical protein SODALDRAFT_95872 [Sodiomyces alkalinus F11]
MSGCRLQDYALRAGGPGRGQHFQCTRRSECLIPEWLGGFKGFYCHHWIRRCHGLESGQWLWYHISFSTIPSSLLVCILNSIPTPASVHCPYP